MTTQELLQSLMNDPEVKDLLARLNTGEDVSALVNNSGINNSYLPENYCCCPRPQPRPNNCDFGLGILLLLLFCCCGCGGGFLFC
ncbi:hypothetical protein [Clostridium sp. UBA4548]|uniref:hypothetical protein n=1 Tax=Clostridium sp. UBA4548 TaxID=1946361 RepID=UPI0025C1E5D1|nr:hypothetical protein [Clostridium sp. UBA4548]